MARVIDYVESYQDELSLPWRNDLAGSERVWMLVYPQGRERSFRAAIGRFELATKEAKKNWVVIDISDDLGKWLANYVYAEALFDDPDEFTPTMYDEFEAELVDHIIEKLQNVDDETVVALIGVATLFPFIPASSVIKHIEEKIRGRLLVFFPGSRDPQKNVFRLLDARDGFNYRAIVINPHKDVT